MLVQSRAVPVDQLLSLALEARNRQQVPQDLVGLTGLDLVFSPLAPDDVFMRDREACGYKRALGVIHRHVVRIDHQSRIEPRSLERLEKLTGKSLKDHHCAAWAQHSRALSD